MATLTKTMTEQEMKALYQKLQPEILSEKQPAYTFYQIKTASYTITAYQSGKVVIQGKDLDGLEPQTQKKSIYPQAGSDEVGTGDYFGPVVVASCIVDKNDVSFLESFHIQDSKQIKDDRIRELAPIIQEHCPHSILIVSNQKYNQIHQKHNMVDIKCRLHNQAYVNLIHKGYTLPKQIIIDQFVQAKSYYRYLQDVPQVIPSIHFETKAENKYLSVACASILARNAFLEVLDKMEEKYQFHFEKGAGTKVDVCGKQFIQKFGYEELNNVAKLHFKNTEKIRDM